MKRYRDLWPAFIDWRNWLLAARNARRGKRGRPDVQAFEFAREPELLRLRDELDAGDYRPGAFRAHWIRRPKPRLISAAPYRDRIVHHALMNVLAPLFERHFHPDSFACRPAKGTHAAVARLQHHLRRNTALIPLDVRKFFPSIDRQLLKESYRRLIADPRVLNLLDAIVDGGNEQESVLDYFPADDLFAPALRPKGLPIGNLTSQWLANWYLNELDHLATSQWRVRGLVRYCDDFILLDNDRGKLREIRERVLDYLATRRRLRIHEECAILRPANAGVTFVGFRVWPHHRFLRKENIRRFRRRLRWMLRAYRDWRINIEDVLPRLESWFGHAGQANGTRLIEDVQEYVRTHFFRGARPQNSQT